MARFCWLLLLGIAAVFPASRCFSADLLVAEDDDWAESFRVELPKGGEGKWTALCESDAGVALVEVGVTLDQTVEPIEYGPKVRVTGCSRTIALVRGMTVKPGPITTAFRGAKKLPAGTSMEIPWSGKALRVVVTVTDDPQSQRISLEQDSIHQKLAASQYGGDPKLLWAGDLDGDGELDLLFVSETAEWSDHQLFTSKGREKGSLVKLAAHFPISGC